MDPVEEILQKIKEAHPDQVQQDEPMFAKGFQVAPTKWESNQWLDEENQMSMPNTSTVERNVSLSVLRRLAMQVLR